MKRGMNEKFSRQYNHVIIDSSFIYSRGIYNFIQLKIVVQNDRKDSFNLTFT